MTSPLATLLRRIGGPRMAAHNSDDGGVTSDEDDRDDRVDDWIEENGPRYVRDDGAVAVEPGGSAAVFHEVGTTIEEDLLTAEMIALPITLVLLVVIFGSVVAATLPLAIGVMSIIPSVGMTRRSGLRMGSVSTNDHRIQREYGETRTHELSTRTRSAICSSPESSATTM